MVSVTYLDIFVLFLASFDLNPFVSICDSYVCLSRTICAASVLTHSLQKRSSSHQHHGSERSFSSIAMTFITARWISPEILQKWRKSRSRISCHRTILQPSSRFATWDTIHQHINAQVSIIVLDFIDDTGRRRLGKVCHFSHVQGKGKSKVVIRKV